MSHFHFDESLIRWQTLAGFQYLHYSILDIDEQHHIVDVLFKFAANQKIVLHRHKVLNKTFVIQGEHRLYHVDGCINLKKSVELATARLSSMVFARLVLKNGGVI